MATSLCNINGVTNFCLRNKSTFFWEKRKSFDKWNPCWFHDGCSVFSERLPPCRGLEMSLAPSGLRASWGRHLNGCTYYLEVMTSSRAKEISENSKKHKIREMECRAEKIGFSHVLMLRKVVFFLEEKMWETAHFPWKKYHHYTSMLQRGKVQRKFHSDDFGMMHGLTGNVSEKPVCQMVGHPVHNIHVRLIKKVRRLFYILRLSFGLSHLWMLLCNPMHCDW